MPTIYIPNETWNKLTDAGHLRVYQVQEAIVRAVDAWLEWESQPKNGELAQPVNSNPNRSLGISPADLHGIEMERDEELQEESGPGPLPSQPEKHGASQPFTFTDPPAVTETYPALPPGTWRCKVHGYLWDVGKNCSFCESQAKGSLSK